MQAWVETALIRPSRYQGYLTVHRKAAEFNKSAIEADAGTTASA